MMFETSGNYTKNNNKPINLQDLRAEVLEYMDDYLLRFRFGIETGERYLTNVRDPLTKIYEKEMRETLRDAKKLFASLSDKRNRIACTKSVKELKSIYYHFKHDIRHKYKEVGLEDRLS